MAKKKTPRPVSAGGASGKITLRNAAYIPTPDEIQRADVALAALARFLAHDDFEAELAAAGGAA